MALRPGAREPRLSVTVQIQGITNVICIAIALDCLGIVNKYPRGLVHKGILNKAVSSRLKLEELLLYGITEMKTAARVIHKSLGSRKPRVFRPGRNAPQWLKPPDWSTMMRVIDVPLDGFNAYFACCP